MTSKNNLSSGGKARSFVSLLLLPLLITGCASQQSLQQTSLPQTSAQQSSTQIGAQALSLTQARRGFKTVLLPQTDRKEPVEQAPPQIFRTVRYPAASGALAAYLSPDPHDGKKHPAIIWITGGDCNSIGDVWSPSSRDNDQTAAAYRKVGIIMVFPSLRGGNTNPGIKEGFLGEVDDVLAARRYLEKQPYVDPGRIYLGGHSTGGTLALLVAESTNRFRSVFAFGPVANVARYGSDSGFLPFDIRNAKEVRLRSPGYWLASVQSPTWVIEGEKRSNASSLRAMKALSTNPQLHFVEISGADHFTTLAPTNELIAMKILSDIGNQIFLTEDEVNANFMR